MTYIVYVATNIINGNRYIGVTSRGLSYRKSNHYSKARAKFSNGGNCPKFHAAIRKYGEDAFSWEILETHANVDDMITAEIRLIAELKPEYNLAAGGEGAKGIKHTEETKAKLSALRKGKKMSPEARENVANAARKTTSSPEYRAKMSAVKKGKRKSPEWRAKISAAHKGKKKPRTPEHQAKITAALRETHAQRRMEALH
jgi:group I intron endonuclease